MSGPYDQYNQYSNQYGAPQQGYPHQGQYGAPQQYNYDQSAYQQNGHPPQQQQGYYGQQPPQGYDQQYGAPAHGGFQHGQQVAPYDPQQQQTVYQQGAYPAPQPHKQFPQQGAYPADQYPQGQHASAYGQPGQQQYGSTDPGAQAEGDRGLMGALGGGAAGYFGGKKMGGHGIMGAIAGAVLGSKLEDKHKYKKHHKNGGW